MDRVFNLYLEEDDSEILVGKIQLTSEGFLTLLDCEPEHESLVEEAISTVNNQGAIVLLTPPPSNSKSGSGTFSKQVARSDADFLPNLQIYFRNYYGLILG